MLRKIGNKLERLEEDIFEGRSEEIVRDISNAKQEIINFRKIVRPQRAALADLERTKRYIPEDLDIYFDDINDASERIWDMLENFKEVVEGLESTNESVLSHRLNDVLRVLTAFSVVMLPLTLLASVFGMNVARPGRGFDRRVLGDRRVHAGDARRHVVAVPPTRLALSPASGLLTGEEVHQQGVTVGPVLERLVRARHADRSETDLLVHPDGPGVRRGRVDGQPVMSALIDEKADQDPQRVRPQASVLVRGGEDDVDARGPIARPDLLTGLDPADDHAVDLDRPRDAALLESVRRAGRSLRAAATTPARWARG